MSQGKRVLLVVEDDPGLQSALKWAFEGFQVVVAKDKDEAIANLRRYEPPVVTLDLGLPPDPGGATEGLATLQSILDMAPDTKVIVVTGNNDRDNAVKAIGLGAWLFFQKPVDAELLGFVIDRAYQLHELECENRDFASSKVRSPLANIVATSQPMLDVCRMVEKLAPTDASVLILGESGTGKELVARALHDLSPRAKRHFVALNCASIPESLLESELFGYEKGAFTGAIKQTIGNIEYANGGTLFLDEIGDLPIALQAKLLRFLQERVITRLGGRTEIPIDVRVICATHRDVDALMGESGFRSDLYYRISEVVVTVPPLRDRPGEATVLASHFLNIYAKSNGKNFLGFTEGACAAIEGYPWPGNVRELENRVKRAVIMEDGRKISAKALELEAQDESPMPFNLRAVRDAAEVSAVRRALVHTHGNVSQAAELLGITRPTCYALINKYNLSTETMSVNQKGQAEA